MLKHLVEYIFRQYYMELIANDRTIAFLQIFQLKFYAHFL